jgi:ssDNA thymidine ADP-ribosyltransferase, DarT
MLEPTLIYHFTHIKNLASILIADEICSNSNLWLDGIEHVDIAHSHIQDRRRTTQVPCGPGGTLHDYVPFYFAPRSPMLFSIYKGNVQSYPDGQGPLIYLVTTVQAVQAQKLPFVFTDGHAVIDFTEFYKDLEDLNKIDWDLMQERVWRDIPSDGDRKRRRQAEFLIYDSCPWSLIHEIGVKSNLMCKQVESILEAANHRPSVVMHSDWYF